VDPVVVAGLAELLGYRVPFQVDATGGVPLVVPTGLAVGRATLDGARRVGRRDGAFSAGQVATVVANVDPAATDDLATTADLAELADTGDVPDTADVADVAEARRSIETADHQQLLAVVRLVLQTAPSVVHLAGDWFWMPDLGPGRQCLRNVSRKMLAVTPALDVGTARRGLVRQRHGIRVVDIPPTAVLAAYYDAHPEFVLDGGTVRSAVPLDAGSLLTPAEQALVAVLRRAPDGQLPRSALESGVLTLGVDRRQFYSVITYTPVVDHLQRGVWRLRT